MSAHRWIVRGLPGAAGALLAGGALVAQPSLPAASCRDLPPVAAAPPKVTASIRGEFLKDAKTLIQDVYLSAGDGPRVRAFVIRPYKPTVPSGGAALFLHWLGEPPANNRTEFFDDAVQLAHSNVTSLLVDALWADPAWFGDRKLADDLATTSEYATQLQGYFRYLMAEAKPNPDRVALVGHDFGAMYGALLMQREPAIRHAVVMAAVGDFGDWFVLGQKLSVADSLQFRERMAVAAPTRYLRCTTGVDVLFQFAESDRFVSRAQATALIGSVPGEKRVSWYAGGHELQDVSRKDRVAWLIERIGGGKGN